MEESMDQANISITDVMGKVIYNRPASGLSVEIDLGDQAKGVYFIQVDNGNNHSVEKIIIQ